MFKTRVNNGLFSLAVSGELDVSTLPGWQAHLEMAERAWTSVLVDLWDVTFFDSRSLSELLATRERVLAGGNRFGVVCDPEGPVRQLFELTGTLKVLQPHADRGAAAAALPAHAR